jgi:hypothetical protein
MPGVLNTVPAGNGYPGSVMNIHCVEQCSVDIKDERLRAGIYL